MRSRGFLAVRLRAARVPRIFYPFRAWSNAFKVSPFALRVSAYAYEASLDAYRKIFSPTPPCCTRARILLAVHRRVVRVQRLTVRAESLVERVRGSSVRLQEFFYPYSLPLHASRVSLHAYKILVYAFGAEPNACGSFWQAFRMTLKGQRSKRDALSVPLRPWHADAEPYDWIGSGKERERARTSPFCRRPG